jgi:MFS family permease
VSSAAGYRDLWRVPTYPWLLTAVFLARLANAMSQVAVVIYLLDRTHSPALAGAGAAAQLVPGLLVGPLAGAWLDRTSHRRRLIVSAQVVRAALLMAVVAVGELGSPSPAVYLVLLAGMGVTFPILTPGFRALVPLLVPRRLWDQSNAADSVSFDTAYILGPALAGATVTLAGPARAIVLQALATLVAAAAAMRVREPHDRPVAEEPALQAAWEGIRVVAGHPALRAVMAAMMISGLGLGAFTIGLPLWAEMHGLSPGAAGWMWAALSAGSILGGIAYGWRRPRGSDARHLVVFFALVGVPLLGVPLAPSLGSAMVCMFVAGLFTAPGIIAMFGIRQRSVPFELQGRTFAITISVAAAAMPFGAMVSGFLVGDVGVHRLLFLAGLSQFIAAGAAAALLQSARRRELATA